MKLGRCRESSKPVATCDRSALFGFTNPTSTEIPRIRKSVSATGAKMGAEIIPGLLASIRKATTERREYGAVSVFAAKTAKKRKVGSM